MLIPIFKQMAVAIPLLLSNPEYNKYAPSYDYLNYGFASQTFGIDDLRAAAGNFVEGTVLETAVGTGIQSIYYDWTRISKYTGVDLSESMLHEAKARIKQLNRKNAPAFIKIMDANDLDIADKSVDTVIDTFSLCAMKQPERTVQEASRIVKATGRVILLENMLSSYPIIALFQRLTDPIVAPLSKGCHWAVDVQTLAKNAGLKLVVEPISIDLGTIQLAIYKKE